MPVITGFKEMVTCRIMLIFGLVLLTNAQLDNVQQIDKLKKGFLVKVNQNFNILSRKRRHYYGNCLNINTWYTIDGNGNTIFLDRQSPDCGLTAMRSFHLVRNDAGSHVRYDISCCNLPLNFKCNTETRNTPFDNDGNGKVAFLDRQFVSCPHNGFIKHFHLNRQPPSKYRYTYSCCTPESTQRHKMNCYNSHTPSSPAGRGKMVDLDKHKPTCRLGYFLNNFKLAHPTLTTMRYDYRCCAFLPQ